MSAPERILNLAIEGMSCQACAARIEKVLHKKPGIAAATVNFASETAQIRYDAATLSPREIITAIGKAGFSAAEIATRLPETAPPRPSLRLVALWLCALPFVWQMLAMLAGWHRMMLPLALQAALGAVVQLGLVWPVYRGAYASLKGGLANMDVLVSLGTLTIWLYSLWRWLSGSHEVYFEAAVMVLAFVSLGKFLEERLKKTSLNSIGLLLELTPPQVQVWRDSAWQTVALSQIRTGELLRAVQGARIGADGVVEDGQGWCDESHLTGEAVPVAKQAGAKVLAGSLLSNGSLTYRAQALGEATLLGDMVAALAQAQGSKAPLARLADQAAAVFVPVVVVVAALTLAATWALSGSLNTALLHAVAVLVIACPCALGLATPAAIMAGMGVAARHGIWFKDAAALEAAGRADAVALDKTGTLTAGKPTVVDTWLNPSWQSGAANLSPPDADTALAWAAALESHVSHPLAQAILQNANERHLHLPEVSHIQVEPGQGVSGTLREAGTLKVGKPEFCGFTLPPEPMRTPLWQHASVVALSFNNQPVAAYAVADALKADSAAAVRRLRDLGIKPFLLSGDRKEVVDFTARELGIEHAHGAMNPRAKADFIRTLQAQGKKVVMVGDGVNDAPALAAADASLALFSGTAIAHEAAGAVLMQHSALQVAQALAIGKATVKTIRQNLFFAFIYNILGIPLAAFGLLNPMLAAAAMALSSISVLGNALRLAYQSFEH